MGRKIAQGIAATVRHTDGVTAPTVTRMTRDVVRAEGPDAVAFLQGQLSQDVERLNAGESAWSFLLQPQGKVDAWFRVLRTGNDRYELDVDEGWGEAVIARLERFKLRTKCELTLERSVPVLAVRGAHVDGGRRTGWPDLDGSDLFGDASAPADAQELDHEGYEALRIDHGVPAMGAELTEDTIPAEAGAWVVDASVSFTKGCFTGQELVARIDSRGGNVPRHLRILDVEGPTPAAGDRAGARGRGRRPGDELGRVGRPRLREAVGHTAAAVTVAGGGPAGTLRSA